MIIIESLQDYIISLLNENKTGNDNKSSIVQELMTMSILSFYSKKYQDGNDNWLDDHPDNWNDASLKDASMVVDNNINDIFFRNEGIEKVFNTVFEGNPAQCEMFLTNDAWRKSFKYQLKSFLEYLNNSGIDINEYSFVHHDTGKSISIENIDNIDKEGVKHDTRGICDFIKSYLTSLNNTETISFKKDEVQKADIYLIKNGDPLTNRGSNYFDLRENFNTLFSNKEIIPISLKLLKKSEIGYKNIIPVITVNTDSAGPNSITYNFNTDEVDLEEIKGFIGEILKIPVLTRDNIRDTFKEFIDIEYINDIKKFNIDNFIKKGKTESILIDEISKLPLTFNIRTITNINFEKNNNSNIEFELSIRSNSHGPSSLIKGVKSFGSCTVEIKQKNGGAQLGKVVQAIARKIGIINDSTSTVLQNIKKSIMSEKISESFVGLYNLIGSNKGKLMAIYEMMINEQKDNTDIVIIYIIGSLLKWENAFDKFLTNISNIAYIGYNSHIETENLDDAIKVAFDSLIVYAYGGAEKSLPYLYLHK